MDLEELSDNSVGDHFEPGERKVATRYPSQNPSEWEVIHDKGRVCRRGCPWGGRGRVCLLWKIRQGGFGGGVSMGWEEVAEAGAGAKVGCVSAQSVTRVAVQHSAVHLLPHCHLVIGKAPRQISDSPKDQN